MRRIIALSAYLIVILIALPLSAQTYLKVDDNTLRCVETKETSTDLTVEQIKHELDGVQRDIERITETYNTQLATFKAMEDNYLSMLAQAEALGIKDKVDVVE